MASKKRGVKESKTGPGRFVVAGIVLFAAVLAVVATIGHPRVRMRPHGPATRARLAVLPFENLTGRASFELLASDVTKSVTESLESAAGNRFEVVPREASLFYKDLVRGIAPVAEALECDYVIDGRIDALEGTILIDLYLFKAGDNPKLWPDRLEWEASRIDAIPGEIAHRIQSRLVDVEPEGPRP